MRRFVLLPGLDGTGALFEHFLCEAPPGVLAEVVALPREPIGYTELCERIGATLRLTPDTVLVAESFSGPLAIMLAECHDIAGLVLCNTFVVAPRPRALRAFAHPLVFRAAPGAALVRRYLVGPRAPDALVAQVRATIASVPPLVLATRIRSVLHVAVADRLARCRMPLLYLRGTEDRLVPDRSMDTVVAAAPGPVSVARVAGPHLLLQAAPAAAWRAIATSLFHLPAD